MGTTQSRAVATKVQPEITSKDLVNQFLMELLSEGYPLINKLQLQEFAERLIAKFTALDECRDAIIYYRKLAKRKDDYSLFNRALSLSNQTEQVLLVNENTLNFLVLLSTKNNDAYDLLMTKLKFLCKEKKLFLKGYHLDTVIASLNQQIELSANALDFIAPFLKDSSGVDYKFALQLLRSIHGPELDIKAKATQKLHHAAPHALEIRERTMLMLQALGLFSEADPHSAFLKDIISFMIEFHDEEQIHKTSYMSVEETTADHLLAWLNEALHLDTRPQLKALLAFIANRVIVLGTTMIFSPIQTVDLSDLYLLIEDAAIQAEMPILHPSNQGLNKIATASMLMTGICDKNPVSLPTVVASQLSDAETSTLPLLSKYHTEPLLIEQFFNTGIFRPYFKDAGACAPIDYQAFFMTLTPHLSMRTELSAKAKPELANALISFITECREKRLQLKESEFMLWYNNEFTKRLMCMVVHELFFTAIASEIAFSHSQLEGLKLTLARLKQYKLIADADTSFIDILVPERDALNLSAFDGFYGELDKEKKKVLIKEIILSVVLQAGAIYAQQPEKAYKRLVTAPTVGRACCYPSSLPPPTTDLSAGRSDGTDYKIGY